MTNTPPSYFARLGPVVAIGVLTGISVVVTRFALGSLPPMLLAGLRLLIGGLGLAVAAAITRRALPRRGALYGHLLVGGVIGAGLPVIGFTASLARMSSGVSSVFTSLVPLITAIVAWAWLKEPMTRVRIAGLSMAFGGALLLILTRTTGLSGAETDDLTPYALALMAATGGACGAVYSRKYLGEVDPTVMGVFQSFAGLLLAIPFIIPELAAFDPAAVPAVSWQAALASGLAGSALGYWLFLTVLQRHGATLAAMSGYVVALAATALGALFLGEVVSGEFVVGAALILGGVYFVSQQAKGK